MGHLVKNIILLCVALLVALLLAEAVIRLLAPQETGTTRLERFPAVYMSSSLLSYELKPGSVSDSRILDGPYHITINKEGTRGKEFGAKAPGEYRVLLLGDSMTFGQGLDDNETIGAQLEQQLVSDDNPVGNLGDKQATVINAGVPGWAPDQEALQLARDAPAWNPDVVFWLIFLGNDIEDVGRHSLIYKNGTLTSVNDPAKYVENGRAVHNVSRTVGGWWRFVKPLQQPLDDHSHLYALVKKVLFTPFVVGETNPSMYTLEDADYKSWQQQTEGIVGEAAQASKTPVVIVLLPHRDQFIMTNVTDAINESRKQWREYANSQLLPMLDTYDDIAQCGTDCYFPLDGHFNAGGASRVAEALDAYIAGMPSLTSAAKSASLNVSLESPGLVEGLSAGLI